MHENIHRVMALILKVIFNKKIWSIKRFVYLSRTMHLSDAKIHDKNVIKSSYNFIIPECTIPEVLVPKFQEYKNFTAVVSLNIFLILDPIRSNIKKKLFSVFLDQLPKTLFKYFQNMHIKIAMYANFI